MLGDFDEDELEDFEQDAPGDWDDDDMCVDCQRLGSMLDLCGVCGAPMCSACFEMGCGVCKGPHR
jgi:hypothetical protein